MSCSYAMCENEATIDRRYTADGEVYTYCEGHDPLEDEHVAAVYEEV